MAGRPEELDDSCGGCGYDLRGISLNLDREAVCPECGWVGAPGSGLKRWPRPWTIAAWVVGPWVANVLAAASLWRVLLWLDGSVLQIVPAVALMGVLLVSPVFGLFWPSIAAITLSERHARGSRALAWSIGLAAGGTAANLGILFLAAPILEAM